MNKPISEMNEKELFCAMAGEYGVVGQAYLKQIAEAYKVRFGHLAPLSEMVQAVRRGDITVPREEMSEAENG